MVAVALAGAGADAPLRRPNPFVAISPAARLAVVVYVVVWRVLPDLAATLQLEGQPPVLLAARFAVMTVSSGLLLLPFLHQRIAGTPTGWLHPLILPALLLLAKELLRGPEILLAPVTSLLVPPVIPDYVVLQGAPLEARLMVELKRDLLLMIAQLSYLAGFLLYARSPARRLRPYLGRLSGWRMSLMIAGCLGALAYFIQSNGGLVAHFSSLALGRFQMRESSGHFLVLIGLLPYLAILWYACEPRVLRRPWFAPLMCLCIVAQFATTGSRANLILPVVALAATWIWANGRLPALRLAILALVPIFGFGLLGELRGTATGQAGSLDDGFLADASVGTALLKTQEDLASREEVSGQIAVMHAVPNLVPHLYGMSYLSTVAFAVPRSWWPDKPRGPGAHVGAIIFGGQDSTAGYEGAAYPAGGLGEAYWNFGVPGVIVVFLLFGLFHRSVAHVFLSDPASPLRALLLVMSLVLLPDIDSDSMVGFLQKMLLLVFAFQVAGIGSPAVDAGAPGRADGSPSSWPPGFSGHGQ